MVLLAGTAAAGPPTTRQDGAHARVAVGRAGELRPAREVVGRREEPLTAEEETAKQIERLLRGPLRSGITGLYVADAKTGEPLFAVNADDALNPASNVKMISTATALELLGPDFRYATRVLGSEPDAQGEIHGSIYLLGSWDPTLDAADFDELALGIAARGVKQLDGDVVIGSDATRDGIFRAVVPIEVTAGPAGEPAIASAPPGFDLVTFQVAAKTGKAPARAHLTYTTTTTKDAAGHVRVQLAIAGAIGKGSKTTYSLLVPERAQTAAHLLRAALRAHGVAIKGDVAVAELGDFISDATLTGTLPIELARHQSAPLAEIVAHVNKWSINWLADRVIISAAAIAKREAPSMELALDAMYGWLARHAHVDRGDATLDTGSGLSYKTRITTRELVSVVRGAAGFTSDVDPALARAWVDSLSVGGNDGTLGHRFRTPEVRGRLYGKTGTLSTVIALSGVLALDPARPLAFSIVTNGDRPLAKAYVRKAHEQVVGLICKYIAKTAKTPAATAPPADAPAVVHPTIPDDLEETEPDPLLDGDAAGSAATPAP
ncbi:MAG TPA: D-alanyl-D-alanine carboxypeptidase/D-alanyl-D-alanine-endopeptidase [Kofleriaceae bacterium]|nr:D-alanyl-D-alanine carboxypeptidase/D-alanyl-D-alanine-endopeptidase [Kofleriaceae bacterium]